MERKNNVCKIYVIIVTEFVPSVNKSAQFPGSIIPSTRYVSLVSRKKMDHKTSRAKNLPNGGG